MPYDGKFLFDGGSTVFLGCGLVPLFTYTAFFSAEAGFAEPSTPAAVQSPAPATATTTPLPGSTTRLPSSITANPISDTSATPATPLPSQTYTSSLSSTTTTTVIVVGAVVALVGGLVFLWFLYMAWKIHQTHKYPKQQQYSPLTMQYSNTSLPLGAPVKKSGLSKWAKIATVVSPIFAIVGLVVAIYFGLKAQK